MIMVKVVDIGGILQGSPQRARDSPAFAQFTLLLLLNKESCGSNATSSADYSRRNALFRVFVVGKRNWQ